MATKKANKEAIAEEMEKNMTNEEKSKMVIDYVCENYELATMALCGKNGKDGMCKVLDWSFQKSSCPVKYPPLYASVEYRMPSGQVDVFIVNARFVLMQTL